MANERMLRDEADENRRMNVAGVGSPSNEGSVEDEDDEGSGEGLLVDDDQDADDQ